MISRFFIDRPIFAAVLSIFIVIAGLASMRTLLFPQIDLTGYLGRESATLVDLFSAPARIWQLAFALSQPIFQGQRSQAQIDALKAREHQALGQYQKTLQVAFGEVREALSAQSRARYSRPKATARSRLVRLCVWRGSALKMDFQANSKCSTPSAICCKLS